MNDLRGFVAVNRPAWERLEALLDRARGRGLATLRPDELRDLGLLHRRAAADLAAARTFHGGSKVVAYLNDLALRSHNAVYRAPRRNLGRTVRRLGSSVPRAVRESRGALAAAIGLFLTGTLLGALVTALDESVARLVLGSAFLEQIRNGRYLGRDMFAVLPASVMSAGLFTNNMTVALTTFALGITGVVPAWILFFNGLMLGSVFTLCGRYELLHRFVPFVVPHGVIEISAILLAGAAAFSTFDGWLAPGDRTRIDGLRDGARRGLVLCAGAFPPLVVAGLVESFVSPLEGLAPALRILFGVALGVALWAWLLAGGRRAPET